MRKCMENQILDAVLRLHILNLTRKHHLIRLAYLTQNINERVVVHFARNVEPFRVVVASNDALLESLVQP